MQSIDKGREMKRCARGSGLPILGSLLLLLLLATKTYAADMACTDCHDGGGAPLPHSSGCTDTPCLESCHDTIDPTQMAHLSGPGTPLVGDRTTICNTCHNRPFDGVYHPYRINTSAGSPTLPGVVDLDQACGQCHGGGTAQASTTGSIAADSRILTVADPTGFVMGARVVVAGAGALEPDGITRGDLESRIESISGDQLTLVDNALGTVSDAAVAQNPTKNGVRYYTKAQLAPVATGIHNSAGVSYPVTFNYTIGSPNTLVVNVDGVVNCGATCPPSGFEYDWNWGDGSANGTFDPDTHTYASSGTKTITLTVRLGGRLVGTTTRSLTLSSPDLPPTAAGTCTWNGNTWTMTLLDASTDDGPDADALPGDGNASLQILVDWGDSSTKSIGTQGASFGHTYLRTGSFTVSQTATDTRLQRASSTCAVAATPAYFAISGTVKNRLGTLNLAGAIVQVKSGATIVRTVTTASNGTFSSGVVLKPGTYSLKVTKSGYTFADPAATITVGPISSGNVINATAP